MPSASPSSGHGPVAAPPRVPAPPLFAAEGAAFRLDAEQVLESMSDGFLFFDREWRVRHLNGEAVALLGRYGVAPEEVAGASLWERFPTLVGTGFEREVRRAAESGARGGCELSDRERRGYELRFVPSPEGVAVYVRDATGRKRDQEEQALLAAAGEVLAGTLDAGDLVRRVAPLGLPLLGSWCVVHLLRDDGGPGAVESVCADPERAETLRELARRLAAPEPPYAAAVHDGESFERLGADPAYRELARRMAPGSVMSVPLAARGRVLGALAFGTDEPRRGYGERDLALAKELASRVALAVDNARLYEAERGAAARTARLFSITGALSGAVTPAQVAGAVVRHGMRDLGARTGVVSLLDGTGEELELVHSAGLTPAVRARWRRFPLALQLPLTEAARERVLVACGTAEEMDRRFPHLAEADRESGIGACAAVPLEVDDRVLGAIGFGFAGPREFSAGDRAFLRSLGRQCAQALERARLYDDAERARAEAEAANRTKSEFLRTMSHELRTPLNAIGGYAELLQVGVYGPITAAQADAVQRIQRNQHHLLGLINDVLNFARIEGGHLALAPVSVAVEGALAALEPLVAPQLAARGLRYRCLLPERPLAVLADPERLQQVLLNLLSNAIKFTAPGGEVTAEAVEDEAGGGVELRVRDTGVGIPPERLEEVFEPFVQLDRGLTRTVEGTGLGLAISRDLARAMGGDLRAASVPGEGSVFTVALPAA